MLFMTALGWQFRFNAFFLIVEPLNVWGGYEIHKESGIKFSTPCRDMASYVGQALIGSLNKDCNVG